MRRCASKPRSGASAARSSTATATIGIVESGAEKGREPAAYTGRFAPSPTGPLHLGSFAAAAASYLEARSRGGRWLLRIEDLDRARAVAGMADQHLRTLEAFGFAWDGPVRVQSAHLDAYAEALNRLRRLGRVYECTCTRAEIAVLRPPSATPDEEEQHYPGLCRSGLRHEGREAALRLHVPDQELAFEDRWQGRCRENVARSVGDFIVRRRDGIYAYQLAVVVDDALQGVTDVVRGCDLITSTLRQLLLQEALGLPSPSYAHVPLIVAADGQKLAKSRHSIAVGTREPGAVLADVLALLRQRPPRELAGAPAPELWTWAIEHWNPEPLCGIHSIGAPA